MKSVENKDMSWMLEDIQDTVNNSYHDLIELNEITRDYAMVNNRHIEDEMIELAYDLQPSALQAWEQMNDVIRHESSFNDDEHQIVSQAVNQLGCYFDLISDYAKANDEGDNYPDKYKHIYYEGNEIIAGLRKAMNDLAELT